MRCEQHDYCGAEARWRFIPIGFRTSLWMESILSCDAHASTSAVVEGWWRVEPLYAFDRPTIDVVERVRHAD